EVIPQTRRWVVESNCQAQHLAPIICYRRNTPRGWRKMLIKVRLFTSAHNPEPNLLRRNNGMHCDRGLFTRVLATTLGLVFLIGSIAAGRAEPGNVQAASATSNMPHQDGRRWNLPDAAKYLD